MVVTPLAPLIAVVGSDGSGKTTVADALIAHIRTFGAAETAHLGLQSGELGRRIAALPVIGSLLDRVITKKTGQARDDKEKIPDAMTALVIYLFSLRRVRRFKRMMKLRRRGIIIVTDRYPQIAVPGFFDGPGLAAAAASGPLVRWLAAKEFALYEWMSSFRPDLVIRLNVDLETALARKPDHRPGSLAQKVAATPKLAYRGAPIVDLSSLDPLPKVVAAAEAAVTPILAAWRASNA